MSLPGICRTQQTCAYFLWLWPGLQAGLTSGGMNFFQRECSNCHQKSLNSFQVWLWKLFQDSHIGEVLLPFTTTCRLSLQTVQACKHVSIHWKTTGMDQKRDELCFPLKLGVVHTCRHLLCREDEAGQWGGGQKVSICLLNTQKQTPHCITCTVHVCNS